MQLTELATDVYACLQPDHGLGWSNSGLINRDGGVVVDTFWDLPRTRAMMEQYARVWKRPARRVVNTHHNGDHCWGNQLFTGAEIIGHRLCAAGFGKEQPKLMQALKRQGGSSDPALAALARELDSYDFTGIELTPPTTLFDERLDLELDGLRVELLYVGPAHTAGDVIAHLPDQRIVFTGDVLFRLCTPIGWEGTFAKWTAALDRIIALDPAVIVPGHGPLCGVEGPREMKAYLAVRAERGGALLPRRRHRRGGGAAHRPRPLRRLDRAAAHSVQRRARVPRAARRALRHAGRRRRHAAGDVRAAERARHPPH